MKNENVYVDIFSGLWCPLFGELPDLIDSPDSQINRCIEIIWDARWIWEVEEDFLISNLSNWPKPDKVNYPEWVLNSARGIWRLCPHIYEKVFFKVNPIIPYIEKADGTIIENRNPLHVILEKAVEYARRNRGDIRYAFDDRVPDSGIISILAIYKAWRVLEYVLNQGYAQESTEIIMDVQLAGDLLRELDKRHIEKLEPDAELGVKVRENLQKAREEDKSIDEARTAELRKLLQDKADELWMKHPEWSISNVARELSKELWPDFKKTESLNQIRNLAREFSKKSWPVDGRDSRKYTMNYIRKKIKKKSKL